MTYVLTVLAPCVTKVPSPSTIWRCNVCFLGKFGSGFFDALVGKGRFPPNKNSCLKQVTRGHRKAFDSLVLMMV
jgi:hypothetical protein